MSAKSRRRRLLTLLISLLIAAHLDFPPGKKKNSHRSANTIDAPPSDVARFRSFMFFSNLFCLRARADPNALISNVFTRLYNVPTRRDKSSRNTRCDLLGGAAWHYDTRARNAPDTTGKIRAPRKSRVTIKQIHYAHKQSLFLPLSLLDIDTKSLTKWSFRRRRVGRCRL